MRHNLLNTTLLIVLVAADQGCEEAEDEMVAAADSRDLTVSAHVESLESCGAPAGCPGVRVASGERHSCVLQPGGTVTCWGDNSYGQLGDGTITSRTMPGPVVGLPAAVEITLGNFHSCARSQEGDVYCWGWNYQGQLGDGTTIDATRPKRVAQLGPAVELIAGRNHTCARLGTSEVACWGVNTVGQLGDASAAAGSVRPTQVLGLASPVQLAAGDFHTCAREAGGSVKCWGWNGFGNLGDGTTTIRRSAVLVQNITGASELASGRHHVCARHKSGVSCWGWNSEGQLGDSTTNDALAPVHVPALGMSSTLLSAGAVHTCAMHEGRLKCWGANRRNQLGDGTANGSLVPVQVSDMCTELVQLSAREGHTCSVDVSGHVRCWGSNANGELGDGTTISRPFPVHVSGL